MQFVLLSNNDTKVKDNKDASNERMYELWNFLHELRVGENYLDWIFVARQQWQLEDADALR